MIFYGDDEKNAFFFIQIFWDGQCRKVLTVALLDNFRCYCFLQSRSKKIRFNEIL